MQVFSFTLSIFLLITSHHKIIMLVYGNEAV